MSIAVGGFSFKPWIIRGVEARGDASPLPGLRRLTAVSTLAEGSATVPLAMRHALIVTRFLLLALCGCVMSASNVRGKSRAPAPLAYDMAAYELAPQFREQETAWNRNGLTNEILRRIAVEKQRRELDVYYYRIGYTLSFPLKLNQKPTSPVLPEAIPNRNYPWLTWLGWELEERWCFLHLAWRNFGDEGAGLLLQQELAALSEWESMGNGDRGVGLVTGHVAASMALALADVSGWKPEYLERVRRAAEALIERDVWPWFQKTWPEQELAAKQLANIPVIALVRSAELARVIGSPRAAALEQRSREVLRAWCRFRTRVHHTEGTAYDGYLMDSLTGWLEHVPERAQLQEGCREAFRSLAESWIALTIPGRPDLHVPLGDTEPEMTFWATALLRLTDWYHWPDARWLLRKVPLTRMRAAALSVALHRDSTFTGKLKTPSAGIHELPNAASLRTGWNRDGVLAVVGLSRSPMGHLHADSGQLILAWQGRCWITDPGYQQYRPGDEREFTLGDEAHNAPVIGGVKQSERAAKLEALETDPQGRLHAQVDLSACYRGLPKEARVKRDVWLVNESARAVVVRDSFESLKPGAEIKTSWQGGTHFGWAFRDGWARLSDGQRALWVGTIPNALSPAELHRHAGSRGPLTLTHTNTLPEGEGVCWWVFRCDPTVDWESPSLEVEGAGLKFRSPGKTGASWHVK